VSHIPRHRYVLENLFNMGPQYLEYLTVPDVIGLVERVLMVPGNGGRGGDAPPDCHMVKMVGAKGANPNRRLDRGLYADYIPVEVSFHPASLSWGPASLHTTDTQRPTWARPGRKLCSNVR
jgi:hypothetical protein